MPFTDRPDTRIHYAVTGEGPPIILGHSFLCSGDMWAPQVGPLSESHTVINVDARGHGESGPAPPGSTLDDMLGDMLGVLDDLGVESAVWAGLSMGGMVALRAALEAPRRVDGLILLDTDAGPEGSWIRFKYAALSRIAGTLGLRPVIGQVMPLMFGRTTLRQRRGLAGEWRDRFLGVDVPSVLNLVPAIADRGDLLSRLPEIDVPTLVVVGAEDTTLPPERARRIVAGIPNAGYLEVERAGHLSTIERPDVVVEAMLEFLASLPGPRD